MPRGALYDASSTISHGRAYFEQMEDGENSRTGR